MKPLVAAVTGGLLLAELASADQTFVVQNNFSPSTADAGNYFGSQYTDSQVWLLFQNSGGLITYNGGANTVSDGVAIALNAVQGGSFNVGVGANSTKVYAALSSSGSNPFSSYPDPYSISPVSNFAYATLEFTYLGNSYDTVDTTYIDTFAYPTKLTTSASGSVVGTSGWQAGTQAQDVVTALGNVMPSGASSKVSTAQSSSHPSAARYVGTSLHLQSGVNFGDSPNATVTSSGPGYNDYLAFLQTNAPTYTNPDNPAESITGWYLDYSGNGGYSGYLTVTGSNGNYGLQITNIRANTGASTGENTNTEEGRAAGTALTGSIVVAANGEILDMTLAPPDYTSQGNWTDMVIASGDQLYSNAAGKFGAGPVITATGDLDAFGGAYNSLTSTFMATVSAIMSTGLLGSETFNAQASTNYWFAEVETDTPLFSSLWTDLPEGAYYWDPYVETLWQFSDRQGYAFPYQDRFSALPGTALNLDGIDSFTWELGMTVPEPSAAFLAATGLCVLSGAFRRRRRG